MVRASRAFSNMLGGGVIVQRFGDLVRGRRSNEKRIEEGLLLLHFQLHRET